MKPHYLAPDKFEAILTDKTERPFLFRRYLYRIRWVEPFALVDRDGVEWRPDRNNYLCDLASVPHPIDWVIPALNSCRYDRSAAMHDCVCRYEHLERWNTETLKWDRVRVSRAQGDSLLQQGIQAEGGWAATRGAYWAGVRIGAGMSRIGNALAFWR